MIGLVYRRIANPSERKDINHDFSSTENEKQKKKFEERILNKVKEILSKKIGE